MTTATKTVLSEKTLAILKNFAGIPVGSGVYLIHVDVPNVGQKTLKSVVFLRPTDVSDF